jgi:hypothetical protein
MKMAKKPTRTKSKQDHVARLVALAGEQGCVDEAIDALDEEVHDAKASEASRINNQGLDAQLEYLVEVDCELEQLEEIIRRANTKPKPEELS